MRTISEQCRDAYNAWNNPPSAELPEGAGVVMTAADTIDALVQALKEIETKLPSQETLTFANTINRTEFRELVHHMRMTALTALARAEAQS